MSAPDTQQPNDSHGKNDCPNCGSTRTRRGGRETWTIYIVLILLAVPSVVIWHLDAVLVVGVMLAAIVLTHLMLNQRMCLDCGTQWKQ
jgi:hypothetical protein